MTENEAINILEHIKNLIIIRKFEEKALEKAIQALKEIKQYRELGTVKEIIHSNANALFEQVELEKYKSTGTVEEFKALKEKNVAKKVVDNTPTENEEEFWYQCPNCKCDLTKIRGCYCWGCGQKLDWQ